jgi:hypothetical protein
MTSPRAFGGPLYTTREDRRSQLIGVSIEADENEDTKSTSALSFKKKLPVSSS